MSSPTENKNKKETASAAEGIKQYFKGVRSEWHRITWPEPRRVVAETVIVIAVVFFFTTLVYLLDILLKFVLWELPKIIQSLLPG